MSTRASLRWIPMLLLALASSPALSQLDRARGGAIDEKRFEDRYTVQSANPANLRFVTDPAGSDRTVMRMMISKNEPKVFNGLRTEIVPRNEYVKEGVRWYALSFYVPAEWKEDPSPILVAQLHTSQKDVILSPPVALVIKGHRIDLELRANSRKIHGPDPARKENSAAQTIRVSSLEKSKWYCFVVRADWSATEGSGSIKVWLDGDKVYEADHQYNSYETWLGNYPKVGLYAPGGLTVGSEQLYVDFIHLGGPRTDLAEMIAQTPCSNNVKG
jgi:hypothetical protein